MQIYLYTYINIKRALDSLPQRHGPTHSVIWLPSLVHRQRTGRSTDRQTVSHETFHYGNIPEQRAK